MQKNQPVVVFAKMALAAGVTFSNLALPILTPVAHAGGCFEDPIYQRSGQVKVIIGARVRSVACMEGSTVLKTLPVGRVVQLIGETDGWLQIRDADGVEGWVGAQLLTATDEAASPLVAPKPATAPAVVTPTPSSSTNTIVVGTTVTTLRSVNMRSGAGTGYRVIRLLKGNKQLTVLTQGKSWTKVKDADGKIGWVSNMYLSKLQSSSSVKPTPTSPSTTPTAPTAPTAPTPISAQPAGQPISLSPKQQGTVPEGIDLLELNRYWLAKVNALRAEKSLRQLVLDQRFINTATDYAAYMGQNHATGHERADGSTMHQWIDKQGITFSTRYSADGWKTNYFTENISWNQIRPTMEAAKKALDDTMDFYLAEASYNGAHYRTTYHADWNAVGAGFYFEDLGNGYVKFYQVFHYGSLAF